MAEQWLAAAAHFPAPWFVLVVCLLAFFSVAGIPLPITVTLLLAGALATHMPDSPAVFGALVVCVAVVSVARDIVARGIGVGSVALMARRGKGRPLASTGLWAALNRWWLRWWNAPARQRSILATQELLERRGILVISLSRFSPLASPIDIAAGMLGIRLRTFALAAFLGRIPWAALLLGAGAASGAAWRNGASLPSMIGLLSLIVVVIIIAPALLSRRALRSTHAMTASREDALQPSAPHGVE